MYNKRFFSFFSVLGAREGYARKIGERVLTRSKAATLEPALGEYACPTMKLLPNVSQSIMALTAEEEDFFLSKIENMGFLAGTASTTSSVVLRRRADFPGEEEEESEVDMTEAGTRAFLGDRERGRGE